VRVALAQLDCALGDVAENVRRAQALIDQARGQDAELIVFPELSLSGYSVGELTQDVAITARDPALLALAGRASGVGVAVGFVEQGPVHTYNSMAYLEGGQVVHVQRKAYLPTYGRFDERKHFSPGQSLAAFEAQGTRLALVICNDAWQPTVPFLAVHDGAQVLILPACSSAPADPAEAEQLERDWHDLLHFHARFLQTYVLFVNRVGSEAGLTFWGGSAVVDPWGEVVARAPRHDPALLVCDLDLSAVRRARRAMPLVKEARLGLLARELKRLTRHGGDL
jgi:predicted amidohydrolase